MSKSKTNLHLTHAANKMKILTFAGLLAASSLKANAAEPKAKARTEITTKKPTKASQDKLSTPIQINSQKDIETLFDYALSVIFAELVLEEVPMRYVYADGGAESKKSTTGVGSTYSPIKISDYNNPDATWYAIARNKKTFWTRTASYEDMLKLAIGWGKYRKITQNKSNGSFIKSTTILAKMYTQLQGISLTPNEFAALYCAVYNAEGNITKLLPLIKKDYKNKVKCANHLRTWYSLRGIPSNPGHKYRCLLEALVFLNQDNFCNSMMTMQTKPSARASCIYAKGVSTYCSQTLTQNNIKTASNKCKKVYCNQLYGPTAVTPAKTMASLDRYFKIKLNATIDANIESLNKDYEKALKLYNQGKYQQALNIFLDIQKRGGDGSSLLNDIALTYKNLHKYDKCISVCARVLKTGDHQEYAKACYNAGLAYEAQSDYTNASKNYTAALKYYKKYGVADADVNVDYKSIYTNAINRVKPHIQSTTKQTTAQKKTTTKKATTPKKKAKGKKAVVTFLAGMTAVKKKHEKELLNKLLGKRNTK